MPTARLISALLLIAITATAANAEPEQVKPAERLFALKVQPLLAEKCFACHGRDPEKVEGGLNLLSRDGLLSGGDSGEAAIVTGNAEESLLYQAVRWQDGLEMPPKENERLTNEQTWWIRDWINDGAPWPSDDRVAYIKQQYAADLADGVIVKTTGALSDQWANRLYKPENLWAYQPLKKPDLPDVENAPANPVDAFINQRLAQADLKPAARADRPTLIRRASFDLLGLPPTPAEVQAFVDDPASDQDAFANLVDRLLVSPHYGEQWGRHWLDVTRYADSSGLANDYERPNAWRYRDYVVRSLNADKPYDQFIREQIAGDEIDPTNPELLIAVGFLRMGPWEQTGMSVARLTRQQFLDDVTDSIGQVFLSHPLQCARCHDHKFDPITTHDYYSLQAVFATTQFAERDAAFLDSENRDGFEQEQQYLNKRISQCEAVLKTINAKHEQAARDWYHERGLKYAPRQQLLKRKVPEDQIVPRHLGLTAEDMGLERIARKNLTRYQWELDRFRPLAFSVYSGKTRQLREVSSRLEVPRNPDAEAVLEQTAILAGGDPFSPMTIVKPGALSMLTLASSGPSNATISESIDKRRVALAQWVASPSNPLTARSMVNRLWHWHFGQAIAGTPNNFGAMGKKPTHPELLDYLAAEFIERGWSIKAMHRLIMSSDAYCRSSDHRNLEQLNERDPQRALYACFSPRRLAAEELRDAMLSASGELNPQVGGIPVRPDINLEAALQPRQIMGTYAPAWQPSPKPEQRNRRSIYALRLRGLRDPFMEVFDQPNPESSCEARTVATITPQVFTLLNGQETYDRALAFAARVLKETKSQPDAIRLAFRLAYNRNPADDELRDCLEHWEEMTTSHAQTTFERPRFPTEVEREAVEEMSGETFTFIEQLDVYKDYEPDLQWCDADARTRALAEVCLVLFNSNEFAYVY